MEMREPNRSPKNVRRNFEPKRTKVDLVEKPLWGLTKNQQPNFPVTGRLVGQIGDGKRKGSRRLEKKSETKSVLRKKRSELRDPVSSFAGRKS